MEKINIGLADIKDEDQLKRILNETYMKGSISVSFQTNPSFFEAIKVQGKENQVVIGKKSNDEIIGFGIRNIKQVYINGEVKEVGYLSGLRLEENYRNYTFLSKGFKFFRELDRDNRVPFYLTTIIEDNFQARRILESGRGGIPNYYPIGIISTFLIKPLKKNKHQNHKIVKGDNFYLEEILSFINKEGSKKQFFPYYEISDFENPLLKGLKKEDFYLALNGKDIIGLIAKWDQSGFKQTKVVNYDKKIKIIRPLVNIFSKFTNVPNLPKINEDMKYFYASLAVTKNNDPNILESLVENLICDENNQDYDYFCLGLNEKDALIRSLDKFNKREYRAIAYLVSFNKIENKFDSRTPYIEIATL